MTGAGSDHIITLENISIGYKGEGALLNGINLSVKPGEMVALIGRNGSGKSTLLKSMIGLVPCLEGSCILKNLPLQSYDPLKRARQVSYVASQLSQWPSVSVRELVSLGRLPHTGWTGRMGDKDRVILEHALREVQLEPLADRKLDQISDGERQRAMIARAFVQDTPLMVLDEPTAFLDIPNKYELVRLLTRFRDSGKSVVYSTHDLETALACADKLWVIHGGGITEGAPEDLGIAGMFNALFSSSGITFDEELHRFKYPAAPRGNLQLRGEAGIALTWTRSALERMGIGIGGESGVELQLDPGNGTVRWHLSWEGGEQTFENIYSLARFLKKDNLFSNLNRIY